MPFAFEDIALRSQVADNSADFMGRKSRIDRNREVVKPKLGFEISGSDMDMRRLAAFVRIEERAIGATTCASARPLICPSGRLPICLSSPFCKNILVFRNGKSV